MNDDLCVRLMDECIDLAREAMELGEAPIAAIVTRVSDGVVLGRGWNELMAKRDPTLHAEIAAFRDAAGRYKPNEEPIVLVSTLEPCIMCAGAAYLSNVRTIVFGLGAPADGGMARIAPPQSPDSKPPGVIGPVHRNQVLSLFKAWLARHGPDHEQAKYIQQLVELNAG